MLVVSRRGRRPRSEDDLAPVAVGVGGQERDLLALDGTLRDGDEGIEPARPSPPAPPRLIISSVPSKWRKATVTRRCSDSWWAVSSASLSPTGMPRTRSTSSATCSNGSKESWGTEGARRSKSPGPLAAPTTAGRSAAAVCGLSTISPAFGSSLHGHDGAGPRTGDDELAVRRADEEEVEDPAVDPHRHPQGDPLAQDGQAPDFSECPPHLDGGAAGTCLMGLTGEEEQQGVAAELEQPAPVGDGQVEKGDEAGPDGGGELLGPHLPVPGQTFGQFGET